VFEPLQTVEYELFYEVEYPYFQGDLEQQLEKEIIYYFKKFRKNQFLEYDPSIEVTLDDVSQHLISHIQQ